MRSKIYFPQPRDRSLEAFKDWMHGTIYRLDSNAMGTMILEPWIDNRQWLEYWTKFWAKVDSVSRSGMPGEV